MEHTFENGDLVITIDADTQAHLAERQTEDDFDSVNYMYDVFEDLVCNSNLDWISPDITGDLTDAPILGILGEAIPGSEGDGVLAGCYPPEDCPDGEPVPHYHPVIDRWGYMDYALKCPQEDLANHGKVVFQGAK